MNTTNVPGQAIPVIGFGRRLAATLIDGVILIFLTFVLVVIISMVGLVIDAFNPDDELRLRQIIILSGIILSAIYYIASWARTGQTVGKTVLGVQVITSHGERLPWGRSIVRYIGYVISGLLLSLGFLWIVFDPKRQGLHDKLAGTYVINVDDTYTGGSDEQLVPSDATGSRWLWVLLWLVLALAAPSALLVGLWSLGPVFSRAIVNLLQGG